MRFVSPFFLYKIQHFPRRSPDMRRCPDMRRGPELSRHSCPSSQNPKPARSRRLYSKLPFALTL